MVIVHYGQNLERNKSCLRLENMGNYDANINMDPRFRLIYLAALMYDMYQIFLNKGKQNQTHTGGTEKLP